MYSVNLYILACVLIAVGIFIYNEWSDENDD